MTSPTPSSRLGRRPGPTETRDAILDAARRQFIERGYRGASLRAIARDASVDPSMISYFFGSKARLFVTATDIGIDPDRIVEALLSRGRENVGERIATLALEHWTDPHSRNPIIALLDVAAADEHASSVVHEFLLDQILLPLLAELGSDNPNLRAGMISAHLTGLLLGRYSYGLIPPDRVDDESIVIVLGPTLQRYATAPLDR